MNRAGAVAEPKAGFAEAWPEQRPSESGLRKDRFEKNCAFNKKNLTYIKSHLEYK